MHRLCVLMPVGNDLVDPVFSSRVQDHRCCRKTLRKCLFILPRFETSEDQSEISLDSQETYGVLGTDSLSQKTYEKLGLESKNGGFIAVLSKVWNT